MLLGSTRTLPSLASKQSLAKWLNALLVAFFFISVTSLALTKRLTAAVLPPLLAAWSDRTTYLLLLTAFVVGSVWMMSRSVSLRVALGMVSLDVLLTNVVRSNRNRQALFVRIIGRKALIVTDPQLAHSILVTHFSNFTSRGLTDDYELDPLLNNIINNDVPHWKPIRTRMMAMFNGSRMEASAKVFRPAVVKLVEKMLQNSGPIDIMMEMNEFTIDMMAELTLSVPQGQAAGHPVMKALNETLRSSKILMFRTLLRIVFPSLIRLLKWKRFSPGIEEAFETEVRNRIQLSDKANLHKDLLQEFIDSHNKGLAYDEEYKKLGITESELGANLFGLFGASIETTINTLSFVLFELARHPEIQQKAREEAIMTPEEGTSTFASPNTLPLLHRIILETLRLHPTVQITTRGAKSPITLAGMKITTGTAVIIPISGIHRDPDIFPSPDSFIPDRFLPGANIPKGAYIPFGLGPRMCLGYRFALMELKVILADLLRRVEFSMSPKTILPVQFVPNSVLLSLKNPIYLDVRPVKADKSMP